MEEKWFKEMLNFKMWKDRGVPTLTTFGVMVDELEEACGTYDLLATQLEVKPNTEWRDKHKALLHQAKVIEAEALFLYCLRQCETNLDNAQNIVGRAKEVMEETVLSAMYQPLLDVVAKAEEYKAYA